MRLLARLLLVLGLLVGGASAVMAQCASGSNVAPTLTPGGNVFGSINSQWMQYFASKVDANNGCANNLNLNGTVTYGGAAISALSPIANNSLLGNQTGGIAVARSILISALEANPTATAGPAAVNGSALTFMRSDASPAIQLGSTSLFGIVKCDGSTIACTAGVISVLTAPASSITLGTTTIGGGGAAPNGLLFNSAGTFGNLATANSGVAVTNGSGVPSISTTLPNGLSMGTPTSLNLSNAQSLPWLSNVGYPFYTARGTPHVAGSSTPNLFTTGNIGSTSTSLTIASALDWVNGEGILVNHAGATFTASPPSSCSVTAHGGSGTGYTYKMSSFDAHGGVGAEVTATASNGATLSGTVYNSIACTPGAGANGMAIWGGLTSGSLPLVALVPGGTFNDQGGSWQFYPPQVPFWLPSVAPTSNLADWLVTSIVSGAGTTTLVLNNAATTTATGVDVVHDDTVALQAGWTTACANGGRFYFNRGDYFISSPLTWCSSSPFNVSGEGRYVATVHAASPVQDFFVDNSGEPNTLRDVGFLGGDGGTTFQVAGSYYNQTVIATVGTETIKSIAGAGGWNGITNNTPSFYWDDLNLVATNDVLNFPTGIGDATITGSTIVPETTPGATGAYGLYNPSGDPGGIRFNSNKVLGHMTQAFSIAPTIQDGDVYIWADSMECLSTGAADAVCGAAVSVNYNSSLFGGVVLGGAGDTSGFTFGFISTSRAQWLSNINFGNGFQFGDGTTAISLGGVGGVNVAGATFDNWTTVIVTDSNTTGCTVGTNNYSVVTNKLIDSGSACGVWTSYAPTVTCSQSTGTAVCTGNARYTQDTNLKTTTISIVVTVSGTFTAGSITSIALPNQSANHTVTYNLSGRENGISGALWVGEIAANAVNVAPIGNYLGSGTIVTGDVVTLSGTYENQ